MAVTKVTAVKASAVTSSSPTAAVPNPTKIKDSTVVVVGSKPMAAGRDREATAEKERGDTMEGRNRVKAATAVVVKADMAVDRKAIKTKDSMVLVPVKDSRPMAASKVAMEAGERRDDIIVRRMRATAVVVVEGSKPRTAVVKASTEAGTSLLEVATVAQVATEEEVMI